MIELTTHAQRARLDNGTSPKSGDKPLPEADRADMEYFLDHLKVILPVVGFDFLKPTQRDTAAGVQRDTKVRFEIKHKSSGAYATAVELEGEFVVLEGSQATKGIKYQTNSYGQIREQLIKAGMMRAAPDDQYYVFARDVPFASPSAAAAVVLDRNANGRAEWKVVGGGQTYGEWQAAMVPSVP